MCEAWNIIVKIFKSYSKILLRCRRYVITLKVCTFPCGWACYFTFTFTFSLPVLSAISLRNRWCTYINCISYLSTSSVVALLQSLIRILYCPVWLLCFEVLYVFCQLGPLYLCYLLHWTIDVPTGAAVNYGVCYVRQTEWFLWSCVVL